MIKSGKVYSAVSAILLAVCFFLVYVGTGNLGLGNSMAVSAVSGIVLTAIFFYLSKRNYLIIGFGIFFGGIASLALLLTDAVLRTITEMEYGLDFNFNINVYRAILLLFILSTSFLFMLIVRVTEKKEYNNDFVIYFRLISSIIMFFTVILYVVCFGIARVSNTENTINLIPFKTMMEYLSWYKNGNWIEPMIQFVGNIMFFFVLGFYCQICFPILKKIYIIIFPFLLSGTIEISQLILKNGNADIDDLILNVFGFFLGWGIWMCCEIISSLIKKSDKLSFTFYKNN